MYLTEGPQQLGVIVYSNILTDTYRRTTFDRLSSRLNATHVNGVGNNAGVFDFEVILGGAGRDKGRKHSSSHSRRDRPPTESNDYLRTKNHKLTLVIMNYTIGINQIKWSYTECLKISMQ